MEKWVIALLSIVLFLTACGSNDEKKETEQPKGEKVEVDKGLLNVEVTLPASFFEDTTEEEIKATGEEQGFKEATLNEDGSVTYKMTKAKHDELMDEMKKQVASTVEEIVNSEDYPSIQEISYNQDFSEFDLTVNKEEFENSLSGIGILGIALSSLYYGAFEGRKEEDLKATFNLIDTDTNEVYDTIVYPDALQEGETTE